MHGGGGDVKCECRTTRHLAEFGSSGESLSVD